MSSKYCISVDIAQGKDVSRFSNRFSLSKLSKGSSMPTIRFRINTKTEL